MTLLQQRRLAQLRSTLDRRLDARDGTLKRLVRLVSDIETLTKAISRAEKRMASAPPPPKPAVIPPPAPLPAPVLDDGIPEFLRRAKPDALEKAAALREEFKKEKAQRKSKKTMETTLA